LGGRKVGVNRTKKERGKGLILGKEGRREGIDDWEERRREGREGGGKGLMIEKDRMRDGIDNL